MRRILFLAFFLLFSTGILPAQTEEEEEVVDASSMTEISLSQMNNIIRAGGDEIFLQDLIIKPGPEDRKFLIDKIFFKIYEIPAPTEKAVSLYFYNCRFEFDVDAAITFKGWLFNRLNVIGTQISSPLTFEECRQTGAYPIRIENTVFNHNLNVIGTENSLNSLRFNNCSFSHQLKIGQQLGDLQISNCKFDADSVFFADADSERTHYQLDVSGIQLSSLDLFRNTFDNKHFDYLYSITFKGTVIGKALIQFLQANTLNLTDATIEKSFLADSLSISNYIAVQNFDFPEENTNLPWYNIGGEKLCIFLSEGTERDIPYQPKSSETISRTLFLNELMACYNKFNNMYDTRGDKISGNANYIEIKNIQTRNQKYLYEKTGELNYYIGYQLNDFARFSSDYATNPARSLIIILWVIVIFAALYLFTYSEWDGINMAYFGRQYALLAEYFKTDKSLKALYGNDLEEEQAHYRSLKDDYLDKTSEIPYAIRIMGKPLYGAWKFRQRLTGWIYDRIEFMHGSWRSLSGSRKFTIGLLTTLILLVFVVFVVCVKLINSCLLSMNMFVSLGFGKTPEQTLPMYISIIQGFVGWFVLTIFSITLLSQMVQNF
ncbi:MAG: hypothetical protein KKD74_07210 [Bacteroidetes bacterium]|nr:hypothetical protein [Bacteroidota bacterium]